MYKLKVHGLKFVGERLQTACGLRLGRKEHVRFTSRHQSNITCKRCRRAMESR